MVRWMLGWVMIGAALAAGPGASAEDAPPAQKCERAEINPVTGHTFCIKPLGAPVEAAPKSWLKPCDEASEDREKAKPGEPWTFRPNCAQAEGKG